MKRIFAFLLLILMCINTFTGCRFGPPRPEIKDGRFDISVSYELNGERKSLSGVYVCEYDGVVWWTINSDPYVNWETRLEGELNTESIPICTTDDGGEIFITLLLYPEYFMGDPEYADFEPVARVELFYDDSQSDDEELIAEYGVKLVGFEYDEPIENSFS